MDTLHRERVPFGVPYGTSFSARNAEIVKSEVQKRFPEWAAEAKPYINILTLKAWNQRGFRVKKGETSIRVPTFTEILKDDEESGDKIIVGKRRTTACLFALPQVERR